MPPPPLSSHYTEYTALQAVISSRDMLVSLMSLDRHLMETEEVFGASPSLGSDREHHQQTETANRWGARFPP